MDHYDIWFDLGRGENDIEVCRALDAFLGMLRARRMIEGWRLSRRKLGFGPDGLGEFHVRIDVTDLAQLDQAFTLAATRGPSVEPLHADVFTRITNFRSGLYRDFPDPGRTL